VLVLATAGVPLGFMAATEEETQARGNGGGDREGAAVAREGGAEK
jgi:hypothetical protein